MVVVVFLGRIWPGDGLHIWELTGYDQCMQDNSQSGFIYPLLKRVTKIAGKVGIEEIVVGSLYSLEFALTVIICLYAICCTLSDVTGTFISSILKTNIPFQRDETSMDANAQDRSHVLQSERY